LSQFFLKKSLPQKGAKNAKGNERIILFFCEFCASLRLKCFLALPCLLTSNQEILMVRGNASLINEGVGTLPNASPGGDRILYHFLKFFSTIFSTAVPRRTKQLDVMVS